MSYRRAEQLFYATSSLVIALGLFLLLPFGFGQIAEFREEVNKQLERAFIQTIGDQAFIVDDLDLVWRSANDFYNQASESTIELFESHELDRELVLVATEISENFIPVVDKLVGLLDKTLDVKQEKGEIAGETIDLDKFMQEESLKNIVPEEILKLNSEIEESVEGKYVSVEKPANEELDWVTLQDNITNELYCVAIYNQEVNRYEGPCKFDYK